MKLSSVCPSLDSSSKIEHGFNNKVGQKLKLSTNFYKNVPPKQFYSSIDWKNVAPKSFKIKGSHGKCECKKMLTYFNPI